MNTSVFSNGLKTMKIVLTFVCIVICSLNAGAKEIARMKSTMDKDLVFKAETDNERIIEYDGHQLEVYDWENSHWKMSSLSRKTNTLYTVDFLCMDEDFNKYNVRIYKKNNKIVKVVVFGEDSTIL